jgi:ABC-type sugar transport system ATPase subunit
MNLLPPGGGVQIGVRPHDVEGVGAGDGDADGRVEIVEALGREVLAQVELAAGMAVRVLAAADAGIAEGDRIGLRWRPDRVHRFDAASGRRIAD